MPCHSTYGTARQTMFMLDLIMQMSESFRSPASVPFQ